MKIKETYIPNHLCKDSHISAVDHLFSNYPGVVRMSSPENSCYYPEKHELILYGNVKVIEQHEIISTLLALGEQYQASLEAIWHGAVNFIRYLQPYTHYWCRNETECTLMAAPGLPPQPAMLIPAMKLDINKNIFDYLEQNDWKIDTGDDCYSKIIAAFNSYTLAKKTHRENIPDQIAISEAQLTKLKDNLLNLDHLRANFPPLDPTWLTDAQLGLWELAWSMQPQNISQYFMVRFPESLESRDPKQDVCTGVVAIDFGTSSTVVAVQDKGINRLLRVGISDLTQPISTDDYQNPTIIEFINQKSLEASWTSSGHQPLTRWSDVHVSHTAKSRLWQKEDNLIGVESTLPQLKQIPLRQAKGAEIRLIDQQNFEFTVPTLEIHEYLAGSCAVPPITLDPIELYAYYLGLFINQRPNIFLQYYLTFPVNYPAAAKNVIHTAFKRGLLRSLPEQICHGEQRRKFNVRVIANEPTAYAAAWLRQNEMDTPESPIHWAVFDFGGGTTDFAFGIYRPANEDKAESGYEYTFEHFGASGDLYLGGENLLDNLAYRVFQSNIEICRELKILFTKPIDALVFPGGEAFVSDSWIARSNTTMLMSILRDVWENYSDVVVAPKDTSVKLVDSSGNAKDVTLNINRVDLNIYLTNRLTKAIEAFFVSLRTAFENQVKTPEIIHLLLAGNASKSTLLKKIFESYCTPNTDSTVEDGPVIDPVFSGDCQENDAPDEKLNSEHSVSTKRPCDLLFDGWCNPEIELHEPMQGSKDDPYRPNGKTGVALGLLELLPSKKVLIIPTSEENVEAPFRYFVGTYKRRMFLPKLMQGNKYAQWYDMGCAPGGAFDLVYSTDPTAIKAKQYDERLRQLMIDFDCDTKGLLVFIRALSPDQVEIALAVSRGDLENENENVFYRSTINLSMEL